MPAPPPDDRDALSADIEATVARCAGSVRAVAAQSGLSPDDVDEVFQQVRLRLWRALDSGEAISNVTASYVYRAATSAAIDLVRKRRRDAAKSSELAVEARTQTRTTATPDDELHRSEIRSTILAAVATLSDTRRPVVRMHLNGYKLDEIADLLGWTRPRTRNLLYRGMDDLRTALSTLGVQPAERGS